MTKKNYDPQDKSTWTEDHWTTWIMEQFADLFKALPWDIVIMAIIYTYGWWKAYGTGPTPTRGDVMLGIAYATTIPAALQGGIIANGYAVAALGTLVAGIKVDDIQKARPDLTVEEIVMQITAPALNEEYFPTVFNTMKGYFWPIP